MHDRITDCRPALTQQDLDDLEDFLVGHLEAANSMPLDVAHGFLAGIVSGPRLILPNEWLPQLIGDASFTDDDEAERVQSLILGLYNDVLHDLEHGHFGPIVVYQERHGGDPLPLPYGWCQGYVMGLGLHGDGERERLANDDEAADYLAPIVAFLMYSDDQLLDPPDVDAHCKAAAELGPAAMSIFAWWRATTNPESLH